MTKNLECITPWWDRKVLAGLGVVAVTSAAVAGIRAMSELSVWHVSLIVSLLCLMIWIARVQMVPSASVSASALVVRNLYRTYEIPWQLLTGIDWEPREGVLSLDLSNGQRVRVEAFSRWPSFGRHRKVIETLEEGRRLAATDQGETGARAPADDVRITEASGITEIVMTLVFGVTLVALVVKGAAALLN
ncbi:PH domain-containing protein [Streptomyces sp. NPDC002680]|uniref:PH domain-containing protein n=1 Tax=Streptomyces sp. NPDC002680 TaxID=3364659 RepID=UPI003694FEDC